MLPGTERFDPDNDAWRSQVADFYAGLQQHVGGVRATWVTEPGRKGGLESVIVALGSAGAFTAAVEYFRAWLARDKTRSLQITHTVDGRTETLSIRGDAIDQSSLQVLADAAARALTGSTWQRPAIEPS